MSAVPDRHQSPDICPICGGALALPGAAQCPACHERALRALDADFLDNYARFSARSRQVVAEACLRALVLGDTSDRKLLAITIYEQFTGAAKDFIGLYYALRERETAPIVQGVLGFSLDLARAVAFFDDLASLGLTDLLGELGLPHPEQVRALARGLDAREQRHVRAALAESLADLERLRDFREVGEQALIGAFEALAGPRAVMDRTEWLAGRRLDVGQVAALMLDAGSKQLAVSYLSTDEETLQAVVDGIDVFTRLTRNVIFAFVSLHGQELSG